MEIRTYKVFNDTVRRVLSPQCVGTAHSEPYQNFDSVVRRSENENIYTGTAVMDSRIHTAVLRDRQELHGTGKDSVRR